MSTIKYLDLTKFMSTIKMPSWQPKQSPESAEGPLPDKSHSINFDAQTTNGNCSCGPQKPKVKLWPIGCAGSLYGPLDAPWRNPERFGLAGARESFRIARRMDLPGIEPGAARV
jgi:hypothetical protein